MKPQPILCDMPYHIKQRIVNYTDAFTKMGSLILCSKEFKTLVKKSSLHFHSLNLTCYARYISVRSEPVIRDPVYVNFEVHAHGCTVNRKLRKGADYIDEAIKYFVKFLKNPDVSFNSINFINDASSTNMWRLMNTLRQTLSTLGHRLSVKETFQYSMGQNNILTTFLIMEPGTLETIAVEMHFDMEEVAASEHWKQARVLKSKSFRGDFNLPYSQWNHFEECSVEIHLTVDLVKSVIENFQQNVRIKSTILRGRDVEYVQIEQYLERFKVAEDHWNIELPEGRQYLKITLVNSCVTIIRCSK